jgi:hypothetical protein
MDDRIAIAFEQFHTANPWVYRRLKDLALAIKQTGRDHYGMKALFEVLRFEHAMDTTKADGLKLNNNYTALYARKIGQEVPGLEDFFQYRERKPRWVVGQVSAPGSFFAKSVNAWDQPTGEVR